MSEHAQQVGQFNQMKTFHFEVLDLDLGQSWSERVPPGADSFDRNERSFRHRKQMVRVNLLIRSTRTERHSNLGQQRRTAVHDVPPAAANQPHLWQSAIRQIAENLDPNLRRQLGQIRLLGGVCNGTKPPPAPVTEPEETVAGG
uniref:(northern house mosquito) hypothetical protein n=1 Tax=Culex pipiens TaxID=7175 RepID=A0A8D8DBG2_CULPI